MPESSTKHAGSRSPGSKRISPTCTLRTLLNGRMRSICSAVKVGKASPRISAANGVNSEAMLAPAQICSNERLRLADKSGPELASSATHVVFCGLLLGLRDAEG